MMKYGTLTNTNNSQALKSNGKARLLATLVVALPLLSMLAGAAMAAHHYGVL